MIMQSSRAISLKRELLWLEHTQAYEFVVQAQQEGYDSAELYEDKTDFGGEQVWSCVFCVCHVLY